MNESSDIKKIEARVRNLCRNWGCKRQDENDVIQEVHLLMLEKPERKIDNATSQAIHRVCRESTLHIPDVGEETMDAPQTQAEARAEAKARARARNEQWLMARANAKAPASPDQIAEEKEEHDQVMARLTPQDRQVAQLLEEGYTLLDVCDKLGLQYGNLHAHLEELRQRAEAGGALYPDRGGVFMPGGECKVQNVKYKNLS